MKMFFSKKIFGAIMLSFLSISFFGIYKIYKSKKQKFSYDLTLLPKQENIVPLLVVGSGPAGLSAALYGARSRLHTIVLAGPLAGGQLTGTSYVENWPGTDRLLGSELIDKLRKQAESFGAHIINESAQSIDCSSWPFTVILGEGKKLKALSIIMASGATPKRLGVEGESDFWGNGVTTCATCDAPYYKNRDVFVVGGGDSAIEEAIQLSAHARSITILVRKDQMRAASAMQERLVGFPSIAVRYTTEVIKVMGNAQGVTGVILRNTLTQKTSEASIDGVFLAIGHEPNTASVKGHVACDEDGFIVLNGINQETSVKGIFAAGDVADKVYKQAGVASGDGIKAALDAEAFLREIGWNTLLSTSLENHFFDFKTVNLPDLREILDKKSFDALSTTSSQPLVVLFSGQACPACVKMLPLVQYAATTMSDKALFIKVDTAITELAEKYAIQRIPVIGIMKEGKLIARKEGTMTKEELVNYLQKHI